MSATIEQKDVRQQLADKIVEALERGVNAMAQGLDDRRARGSCGIAAQCCLWERIHWRQSFELAD